MKRLEILLAFLVAVAALDPSEASLLARGRPKTRKLLEERAEPREAPYVCLDASEELPPCNYRVEGKNPRPLRSTEALKGLEDLTDRPTHRRSVTIVYKIEGCLPSRLPFVLPDCKPEDTIDSIVEVRRLFPFKPTGQLAENSEGLPTLIFPEVDTSQLTQQAWSHPEAEEDEPKNEKVTRQIEESPANSSERKPTKRKKAEQKMFEAKKASFKKFNGLITKKTDVNNVFSEFPSSQEQQRLLADSDLNKKSESPLNRVEGGEEKMEHRYEFPYEEAIPYDPEKLRLARPLGDLLERRGVAAKVAREFPYGRAIPFDSEKLESARIASEFPYSRAIAFDERKLKVGEKGSEFPYSWAVPFDKKMLEDSQKFLRDLRDFSSGGENLEKKRVNAEEVGLDTQKVQEGKEVVLELENLKDKVVLDLENLKDEEAKLLDSEKLKDEKEEAFDLEKLLVGERGTEFPYSFAIPFDRKKLEDRGILNLESVAKLDSFSISSRLPKVKDELSKPQEPPTSTKLQIDKRGSEFPYSYAISFDPNKLQDRRILNIDTPYALIPSSPKQIPQSLRKKPQEVPFDTSMLNAAKTGSTFPYSKATPHDTSGYVDRVHDWRSEAPQKMPTEVKHSGRPWSLYPRKDQERLERLQAARELEENLVSSWNEESRELGLEDELRPRLTRTVAAPEGQGGPSTATDTPELPSRWSEFPYSKAIPFDPEKLGRASPSSSKFYLRRSATIPKDFPYAKAIPYDPWKLASFRRKKSKAQSD